MFWWEPQATTESIATPLKEETQAKHLTVGMLVGLKVSDLDGEFIEKPGSCSVYRGFMDLQMRLLGYSVLLRACAFCLRKQHNGRACRVIKSSVLKSSAGRCNSQ